MVEVHCIHVVNSFLNHLIFNLNRLTHLFSLSFISRVEACSQSSGNISIPPNTLRNVQLETYEGSCYKFSKKNRTSLWRKFVKGNYVKYYIYQ